MSYDPLGCDRVEFQSESRPVARKPHKCCECLGEIPVGEKYRRITLGGGGDKPDTYKFCAVCDEAHEQIAAEDRRRSDLGCWDAPGTTYGDLAEYVRETGASPELAAIIRRNPKLAALCGLEEK